VRLCTNGVVTLVAHMLQLPRTRGAHGVHAHLRSWDEAGPAHAVHEGPDNPAALLLTSSGMQVPAAYLFVVK
jgi:hypothetical protein